MQCIALVVVGGGYRKCFDDWFVFVLGVPQIELMRNLYRFLLFRTIGVLWVLPS